MGASMLYLGEDQGSGKIYIRQGEYVIRCLPYEQSQQKIRP
jgi:hypothetical protein